MKKLLFIFLILPGMMSLTMAQSIVTNTSWEMDASNEKVIVTYDLNRQGEIQYFSVELLGVLEGVEFKARAVSGDVGPYVRFGRKNQIVWEIYKDVAEADGSLSVKVVAENAAPDPGVVVDPEVKKNIKTVPVYAGLGGVVVLGGGLLVTGVTKSAKAKTDYDEVVRPKYEGLVGPQDATYRQDYEAVNKRYKSGQMLMAGGGAIIAIGGVMLIKRLIDLKKVRNRTGRLEMEPQLKLGVPGAPSGYAAGVKIHFNF